MWKKCKQIHEAKQSVKMWCCREFRKVKGQAWMFKQGWTDFPGQTGCLWICCSNPPFSKYWPPYISATHLWWTEDYSPELTVHIWLFLTVRGVQTACLDRLGFVVAHVVYSAPFICLTGPWGLMRQPFSPSQAKPQLLPPCDLCPECPHNTVQNFTHSPQASARSKRHLSCL